MLSTAPDDFVVFVEEAAHVVAENGKTPVGWHEMGKAHGLPAGTVGQYWDFTTPRDRSAEYALTFVRGGGSLILSPFGRRLPRHRLRRGATDRPGLDRQADHPCAMRSCGIRRG